MSLLEWCNAYLDFSKERYVTKTYDEKRNAFRLLFESGFAAGSGPDVLTPFALLRPATRNGTAVKGTALVPVAFELR